MKLLSVKVDGFRNVDNGQIQFDGPMTALVSTNSYGKSNLMQGIAFAIEFLSMPSDLRLKAMGQKSFVPINRTLANRNFYFEVSAIDANDEKACEVRYGYEFAWKEKSEERAILREWLEVRESGDHKRFNRLIWREGRGLYKSSPTGRCTTVINVQPCELVLNRLQLMDRLYYKPLLERLAGLRVHFEEHLDAGEFYERLPFVFKGEEEFGLDTIMNIPRTVHLLQQRHPEKYALLIDAFVQLFPSVQAMDVREVDLGKLHDFKISEDAPFRVASKVYSLFVQDVNLNQPIDFSRLSDGAKRIFLMLTCVVMADIRGTHLLEFEEPENCIHPGLLQRYLRVLAQLAGDVRIVLASHSPLLIQYLNPTDIYVGAPNQKGIAQFKRIAVKSQKGLLKDAVAEGVSVGEYLFDLLSGSDDSVEILQNYLE